MKKMNLVLVLAAGLIIPACSQNKDDSSVPLLVLLRL